MSKNVTRLLVGDEAAIDEGGVCWWIATLAVFGKTARATIEGELPPKKRSASSSTLSMSSRVSTSIGGDGRVVVGDGGNSGGEDGGVVEWTWKVGTTDSSIKRDIIKTIIGEGIHPTYC